MKTLSMNAKRLRRFILTLALVTLFMAIPAQAASLKIKKFSAGKKLYITLGQSVNLTAEATGGSGKKSYRFRYKLNGKTRTFRKYKTSAKATFTPTEAGSYKLQLTVKDKKGRTASKTIKLLVKAPLTAGEKAARQKIINTASAWLGTREHTAQHREILGIYNKVKKNVCRDYLGGGGYVYGHYNVSEYDAWCDTFVSAVFLRAGLSKLIGVECSCYYHVAMLKRMDSFVEDDDYIPTPGDIIFYDWHDSGNGDCMGVPDHVGIVSRVTTKGTMTIIEGNYKDSVTTRQIKVNSRYIRGYGVPKYAK